jgi:hypothetical protein
LYLSANITKFTVKTCFSCILFLRSTEPIVQNFSPVLYIVLCYTLDIGFFWTIFPATCWPQSILLKTCFNYITSYMFWLLYLANFRLVQECVIYNCVLEKTTRSCITEELHESNYSHVVLL